VQCDIKLRDEKQKLNRYKQRKFSEQTKKEKNFITDRSKLDLQNREESIKIDIYVLLIIQSKIYNQGGRVVLGRNVVL
jgi:hypothetical protein